MFNCEFGNIKEINNHCYHKSYINTYCLKLLHSLQKEYHHVLLTESEEWNKNNIEYNNISTLVYTI